MTSCVQRENDAIASTNTLQVSIKQVVILINFCPNKSWIYEFF